MQKITKVLRKFIPFYGKNKYNVHKIEKKEGITKNTGYTSDFFKWNNGQAKIINNNKTALPYIDAKQTSPNEKDWKINDGPVIEKLTIETPIETQVKQPLCEAVNNVLNTVKFYQLINDNKENFYDLNKIPTPETANISTVPFGQNINTINTINVKNAEKIPPRTNTNYLGKHTKVKRREGEGEGLKL